LIVSLTLTTGMAKADPVVLPFVIGVVSQMISDQRQNPVDRNVLALNPIYNTMWAGNQIGSNPDPKTIVSANCRGTQIVVEPGQMGRRDIVGFEMTSNNPAFPRKIAMFWRPTPSTGVTDKNKHREAEEAEKEWAKLCKKYGLEVQPTDKFTSESPRMAKWQLPVETISLPQGLYQATVRVFFVEQKASGFFRVNREDVIQRDETLIRFVVLDPAYMEMAANSPEIQANLRASFGLMGGPPQIGGMNIAVSPEMARNLPQPGQVPPAQPAQPVQPTPPAPPAQQAQPQLPAQPVPPPAPVVQPVPQPEPAVPPPAPQPEVKATPITVVVWLGATKQIWRDQTIPLGMFKEGHAVVFRNGNVITAEAIVQAVRPEYNLVEIRIAKGTLPASQFSMEVK